jgi:hypothetical protein
MTIEHGGCPGMGHGHSQKQVRLRRQCQGATPETLALHFEGMIPAEMLKLNGGS